MLPRKENARGLGLKLKRQHRPTMTPCRKFRKKQRPSFAKRRTMVRYMPMRTPSVISARVITRIF